MIAVHLAAGEVVLGSVRVQLERVGNTFRLSERVTVRTANFGERSWAAREALAGADLVEMLRTVALQGEADVLSDAVMLALAGGGEEAPPFEICAVEAARIHGWSWKALNEAPAIEVDRAVAVPQEDGWKRFVFGTEEMEELVKDMTGRLLDRAAGGKEPGEAKERWEASERSPELHGGRWNDAAAVPRNFSQPPLPHPQANRSDAVAVAHVEQAPSLRTRFQRARPSAARPWTEREQATDVRNDTASAAVASVSDGLSGAPVGQAPSLRPSAQRAQAGAAPAVAFESGLKELTAGAWSPPPEVDNFVSFGRRPERPRQPEELPHIGRSGFPGETLHMPRATSSIVSATSRERNFSTADTDWLEEIARSLADECDLRGLDA